MIVTIVVAAALSVLAVGLHYESLVAASAVVRAVSGSARVNETGWDRFAIRELLRSQDTVIHR